MPMTHALLAVAWLLVVSTGLIGMWRYASAAGPADAAPPVWAAESNIQRATDRPTLLVFAHPRCPCTRATIGELALLMARCPGRITAQVWFFEPAGAAADWTHTDLWRSAAAIPGVTVAGDEEGGEARRFHATTSGQTLLYDALGRCRFSGGITAARGHSGDNAGRDAVLALVNDESLSAMTTPVFGCSLCGTDTFNATLPQP